MIAPDRKADYSTRLDNYFSSPAPRFIHFLCTYQYKYPNITDSAGTQGDSTTEFVLMATLIDNGTELRGLGSNEIRVVDPKFVTLAQYKHPDYFVE